MKKIVLQALSAGLGLCLVLGQYSFSIQSVQAQVPSSCRSIIQTDLEERSRRLESETFDSIDRGKFTEAINSLNQLIQVASRMTNEREKALIFQRAIEGEMPGGNRINRLVRQAKSNQRSQAINLLETLQQFVQRLSPGYSATKAKTLTTVAIAYRELEQPNRGSIALSQALQAAQSIRGADFQPDVLTPIAREYLALGKGAEAERVLNQSFKFAQQANKTGEPGKNFMFEAIASTYAKLGKVDQALQIARTIQMQYYRSLPQAEVVRTYLRTNQIAKAQQLAQKIENVEIKFQTLGEIAIYFVEAGQVSKGNQFFQQTIQTINSPGLSDYHRSQLIQNYAKVGQREVALQAANALTEKEQKAIALTVIALEYAKVKQPQQVDRVLTLLAPLVQQADPYDPVGYLPTLINTAIKEKQYKLAYELARNVKDGQSEWLWRVSNAAIAAGEVDLALQIVRSTDRGWVDFRSQSFEKIAAIYAQRNQIDQALRLVEETENAGSSPYRIATLARIAALAGTRADEIFGSAIAQANQLNDALFKSQAYGFIARASFSSNKIDQGQKYLKLAINTAKQEKDPQSLAFNLGTIADHFIGSEQFINALEVAKAIPEPSTRNYKLGEIFSGLVQKNALDQAGIVAAEYREPEIQARSLITLAQAQIAANQSQRAIVLLTTAFQVAQTVADPEVKMIQVREDLAVDDDNDRASLLEAIARLYAQLGQTEAGLKVAQNIQDPKLREPLQLSVRCYR